MEEQRSQRGCVAGRMAAGLPPRAARIPAVYPIVDVEVAAGAGWEPRALGRVLLDGGARLIQLRAKTLASGPLLALAAGMAEDAAAVGAQLVVNDRADLAVLSGAAGVHVGQDDLSVADVRRVVGAHAIIGLSTHSAQQLAYACGQDVSYVAVGPVFRTATKETGYHAVGLDLVRAAVAHATPSGLPVVAIGGITLERAQEVWAAGARSIAVITDVLQGDPAARVAAWVAAAGESRPADGG
jgi:thiamine-phosphate pyrophosphorylase